MNKKLNMMFALCAIAGTFGLVGCDGDDSSKSESGKDGVVDISISPSSLELTQGDENKLMVTYKIDGEVQASQKIEVATDAKDCVTVDSEYVMTNDNGEATINISALGANCDANITARTGDNKATSAIHVQGNDAQGSDALSFSVDGVTKSKLELDAGDEVDVIVRYLDENKQPNVGQDLQISSNNTDCVTVAPDHNYTDQSGQMELIVTALDEAEDQCQAKVKVKDGKGVSSTLNVTVNSPEIDDNSKLIFTDPSNKTLNITADDISSSTTLKLQLQGTGKTNGVNICFESSDMECAYVKGCAKTDDNGEAVSKGLKIKKADCSANITAYVKKNTAIKDIMTVTVGPVEYYNLNVNLNFEGKRCEDTQYAGIYYSDKECADIFTDTFDVNDLIDVPETFVDTDSLVSSDKDNGGFNLGMCPSLASNIKIEEVPVSAKSIIAYATNEENGDGSVIAHACDPLSLEDASEAKTLQLIAEPIDITGTYWMTSNFDFTSGLEKSGCTAGTTVVYTENGKSFDGPCVAHVESMKAGDWVDFIVNFTSMPLATLLEFIWTNTLERLDGAFQNNSTMQSVIKLVLGSKMIALPTAYTYASKWLSEQAWYKVFTSISGDIAELASNMQLSGQFEITNYNRSELIVPANGATTSFNAIEYQWSLSGSSCATDPYHKYTCEEYVYNGDPDNDMCRNAVALNSNLFKDEMSMSGTWGAGAEIVEAEVNAADNAINIKAHNMTFKWATILYNVVFGKVLPSALEYDSYDSDNAYASAAKEKGLYIKALLSKLLFQSVMKAYGEYVNANSTRLGNLKFENNAWVNTDFSCDNFFKALIEWILAANVAEGSTVDSSSALQYLLAFEGKLENSNGIATALAGMMPSLTKMVCETNTTNPNYNLDALDAMIQNQLNKIEVSTTNGLTFTASDCPLYTAGTEKYQYFGKADKVIGNNSIVTAKEVNDGESTNRCRWTVSMPGGSTSNINFKGLFHAIRTDNDLYEVNLCE